jgi:hypothetical protein
LLHFFNELYYDARTNEHQMHFPYFLIMQHVNPTGIIDRYISMWRKNTKNYMRRL